jgi:nucleoside-diphosphate-sugar epimerase
MLTQSSGDAIKVADARWYKTMANSTSFSRIIVTGARSIIGRFLLPALLEEGYEVHAISRKSGKNPSSKNELSWHLADISEPEQFPGTQAPTLVHLAPLWLLPPLLPALVPLGIKRVIAFGSTSVFSKASSADSGERELAVRLAAAEEAIRLTCGASGINWTVFRPTLVYDCAQDKNISRIARFIERYGFFPLLGKAEGLRQPIHADDLAKACVKALDQPMTFNRAYNLSGAETLTYRRMVEKIFDSLGKPARLITVPPSAYYLGISLMRLLSSKGNVTPEMATRMNMDLCFTHTDATRDFGFAPRPFVPSWKGVQK